MPIYPRRDYDTPELAAHRMFGEVLQGIKSCKSIKSGHDIFGNQMTAIFEQLLANPGKSSDDLQGTCFVSDQFGFVENMIRSIACLVSAIHVSQEGRQTAAWTFVLEARHHISSFAMNDQDVGNLIKTKRRRQNKLLDARHHENHSMKEFAINWYLENCAGMSKDAAAHAIAEKIVPAKFRTVRGWLTKVK